MHKEDSFSNQKARKNIPRERKVALELECQIIATLVTRNEPFFFRNSDINFASAPHWAKIQDSRFKILYFALFISLTTANIDKAENRGKQRLTNCRKKGEVSIDLSSKSFRDRHYHMISREKKRKIFVMSWHTLF